MYVNVHYHESTTRSLMRYVTCEKCVCEFMFPASGRGSGTGRNSLIGDGRQDAHDMAAIAANEAACLVTAACPDCGWFNGLMVRTLRRQHLITWAYVGVGALALSMSLGWLGTTLNDLASTLSYVGCALVGVAGIAILAIYLARQADFHPNAGWPLDVHPELGHAVATRTPEYAARIDLWNVTARAAGWYYQHPEGQRGPVPYVRLVKAMKDGQIEPGTLVWSEAIGEWMPAIQVLK